MRKRKVHGVCNPSDTSPGNMSSMLMLKHFTRTCINCIMVSKRAFERLRKGNPNHGKAAWKYS
jgi:hypothetical protein